MFHREQNLNKLKLEGLVSQTQTWWSSISGGETKTIKGPLMGKGFGIYQDSDCIHKGKRCLLFGRKAMTNLDSILKSREITLTTKVCIVKAMVFPVVMYRCESWTIKKAEHQRINAFKLQYWRRLLRIPWIARRSNQSILKEINPEYSLEGLILKLKLWYFGYLMQRAVLLEKTLMLQSRRRRERQRMRWSDDITVSMDMSMSTLQEMVKNMKALHAAVHGIAASWTRLSNWTTTTKILKESQWITDLIGTGIFQFLLEMITTFW